MNKLEIIKHYKTILACEQFILTGSTALQYHGLVETSSDIDIILVNPTDECKKIIEKLEEKSNTQNTYKASVAYIFEHEGVKIDIFIETTKTDCCSYEGVFINPIKKNCCSKKENRTNKRFCTAS